MAGVTTALVIGATAATAATVYSARQQKKAAKAGGSFTQAALPALAKEVTAPVPEKVDTARTQAQQQIKQRQRAIRRNRTIFTNPLGAAPAQTVKKTLLGE